MNEIQKSCLCNVIEETNSAGMKKQLIRSRNKEWKN